jgi:N-acetylglutamate synthase
LTFAISPTDIESIECATVAAVPPDRLEMLPGWLLPMDGGTIGRSHSAVPLRHDESVNAADVATVVDRYRAAGLLPKFRVADVPALTHVHTALRQAGLQPTQPTLTMVAPLPAAGGLLHAGVVVSERPAEAWRQVYLGEGFDPVDGAHRVRALMRAQGAVYACAADPATQTVVATGVGSLGHGWLGIHGMRTLPTHRGRGHATGILRALALSAGQRGVLRAYLQVEDGNPAIRLYESLGFRLAWRYHYWRPDEAT